MSKQVLSIDQMKHLKELGLNIERASFLVHVDYSTLLPPALCLRMMWKHSRCSRCRTFSPCFQKRLQQANMSAQRKSISSSILIMNILKYHIYLLMIGVRALMN